MGRPRLNTHILEARGAFVKDPARGRARAQSADSYFVQSVGPAFPSMPDSFLAVKGVGSTNRRRLRDMWELLEARSRRVNVHEKNFEKLPFVCQLLVDCRHGDVDDEERALARRWLSCFGMEQSFANRIARS